MNPYTPAAIERKPSAWWAENFDPEMRREDVFRLNEMPVTLYPPTAEEREQKWQGLMDIPEFVL